MEQKLSSPACVRIYGSPIGAPPERRDLANVDILREENPMRRKQNLLLAGVAALALVAGTGLSLAQTQPSQSSGTQSMAPKQGAGTSSSTTNGAMMQHGNAGASAQSNPSGNSNKQSATAQQNGNRSAQSAQSKMGEKRMNHAAQNKENRSGAANTAMREHGRIHMMNTAERNRRGERFGTAEEHRRGERTQINTAEQRNGHLRGLQANTSIPMEQHGNMWGQHRTEIDRVIDASDAPRADGVDFNVRVGTVVPRRSVRFVPVPETLVQIEPRWHGYNYFVYENQVVVVSPRTMRIVAVLPA
jgi:hypothetical protein